MPMENDYRDDQTTDDNFYRKQLPSKKCRLFGICLQASLFVCNGAAWVISIIAITGGLIVGFSSQTININFEWADFALTTPATIFIMYGFALLIVTGTGCFVATGANGCQDICYIALIIVFISFDLVFGIWILFSTSSLKDFLESLKKSMDGYGQKNSPSVGIIPLSPNFYWDHFHKIGKCCGLYTYKEWKNASIGKKEKSLPDSCCNAFYEHRYCGQTIFQHPDMKDHGLEDMINTDGCLHVFPPTMISHFEEITYMGLVLCALLIFSLVIAIVLLLIICTRQYDPGQGIDNYHMEEIGKNVSNLEVIDNKGEGNPRGKRNTNKVYPAEDDGIDSNARNRKKVNFQESGPKFIPSEHYVGSDDDYYFPSGPSVNLPINDYKKSQIVQQHNKH